jgi:predicted metal-dependent enzyme (double-stranded beta helix superfamily)
MSAVFSATLSAARTSRPIDPGLSLDELTSVLRCAVADARRWQSRLRLPEGDDRWWTLLSRDERVDIWLLSWLPGQGTNLHDHGPSAAAFTVVRGLLGEVRVNSRGLASTYWRRPDSVTWLAPGMVHDVAGAGVEPAVSIHAYSPPLREMNYYAPDPRGRLHMVRTVVTHEPEQEHTR